MSDNRRPTMQTRVSVTKRRTGKKGSYKAPKATKRSAAKKQAAAYGRKMAGAASKKMREGASKSKYTGAAARSRKY